jgi:hypothetical protein
MYCTTKTTSAQMKYLQVLYMSIWGMALGLSTESTLHHCVTWQDAMLAKHGESRPAGVQCYVLGAELKGHLHGCVDLSLQLIAC